MKARLIRCLFAAAVLAPAGTLASPITWDNSNLTNAWSTAANWNPNTEPTAADDLTFPVGLSATITTTTTENALSLRFDAAYTLSGGTLALPSGNSVNVANGVTATINNALTITGGLSKIGTGTLVLGGSNANTGGTIITAGTLRATHTGAMGAAGAITTVNDTTTLEIGGISLDRPITLKHGGTVAGTGAAASTGVLTIDAAATAVTLGTTALADVLTLGNAANDLTGGTAATVIGLAGPGTVQLASASNFDGSWNLTTGTLGLASATALGDTSTSSVTLAGGTLAGRAINTTGLSFTSSPGNNLLVTASSSLLSDRTTAAAVGTTFTFGSLAIGSHTLTVGPGPNATSGTAAIVTGNVTLTGNPQFAVNDLGVTAGKFTTGSWLGGGIARTITKTGAGDLTVTGGTTDLPVGSQFTATGGGTIEMAFADLGATASVTITAAQNPFGQAAISITDGALRLLANGSNTSLAQTFILPSAVTLGGTITLDPDERSGSNSIKTFELPGLTLATGTALSMAGDNTYGVRLTGPLALQGNATLKGIDTASKDGLLTLNGGISGGPATVLTIGGGTSLLNLTIAASGTYGGGTLMTGSNVTLNAINALGTGPLTLSGGSLVVNTDNALVGTVTVQGGTLRVNDTNALAANPISQSGGTLDFRNNTTAVITTGALTVSGTSAITIGNNGSGSSQTFDFPLLNVAGNTTLTVTPSNSFVPNFLSIVLAGNLTLTPTGSMRIQSLTEDASPRTLIKAGLGTLELEGINGHSGGTEVTAGILLVENAGALGAGALTLGATSGSAIATAQFNSSLIIPNDLVVRSGSSGILTFNTPAGGVTWSGGLTLQQAVTLNNASSTVLSSFDGVISGSGAITKISAGEIVLRNAANSFQGTIALNDGSLSLVADGGLGHLSNGVTLAGDAVLKIDASFASSRTFTFTGTTNSLSVTGANEFTLNSGLAGAGTFIKSGTGIMTLAPGVDSSARGGATSSITGGILRVQGVKNLSDTGIITLNGSAGTIEFLRDANTTFPHPVTADGTGTLHVDRAIGGAGINGRHTLGSLGMISANVTVTGANGYGLSFGAATVSSTSTLTNNAPGALVLASFTGNPGSANPTMTFGGSGEIQFSGALAEGAGTGNYGLTKIGTGTLRFGTSVVEFARLTTVNDGTLDLNGLSYPVTALTMGGTASALGAQLVTGAGGSLELGGTLTFSATSSPPGALITGNLGLGAASRSFVIGNSTNAPADLTIAGPIGGAAGAAIVKSGAGTLRFTGAGNTQPGLISVSAGFLELAKSAGDAVGLGGLSLSSSGMVHLAANEQINNNAAVALTSDAECFLELKDFTETVGPLTLTQTDANDYVAVKTGATGTLVLNGNLTFNNNTNSSATSERDVLITGTGSDFAVASDGTLDLGGAVRTIHVATTTVGANEPNANATIETRIINGGILKTGPRTLYLTHPNNSFAGGLQIAQGFVQPASGSALGLGPVTFTNGAGVTAGLDFGSFTGTLTNVITTGSGGEATFMYSALAPNALVLSGGFNIGQDLIFDVVNGTVKKGDSAVLDVTGPINDAAGTFGLRKRGNGTLKLAAGNTFGGGTVIEKGILAIAADSSLGDTTAPLTIDGGCLASAGSCVLSRSVAMAATGGSLRAAGITHTMEIAGALTWSTGTTAIDGSGRTIISGATTGPVGNLVLGVPIAFAPGTVDFNSRNSRVCLQGAAALPAGNLSIVNHAVLELGNGNFTRPLGTGAGEVQLPTLYGGGWAAVGADRSVNLGGAGATLLWGQTSPPFLYDPVFGGVGELVLGSITGTHTVEFQNPLHFTNGPTTAFRGIVTNDGAAAVDARISGDLGQAASLVAIELELTTHGTLEITGDILGEVSLSHSGAGTTLLSGTNGLPGDLQLFGGTLKPASNASFGSPGWIYIDGDAHLDASAMTVPVTSAAFSQITVDGLLTGNVVVGGNLAGGGVITGNVVAPSATSVDPGFYSTLYIGGDFTLAASAWINFSIYGTVPEEDFNRLHVVGAVNLAGGLSLYSDPDAIPVGFSGTLVLILNDGSDPISGAFAGYPEGSLISLGDGRSLRVTYLANGDGGAVANDFGLTVVTGAVGMNLALTAAIPLTAATGAAVPLVYTITNLDLVGTATGASLILPLPGGLTQLTSSLPGSITGNTLTIPLPSIAPGAAVIVTITVTLSGTAQGIQFVATVDAPGDPNLGNNSSTWMLAALTNGTLPQPAIQVIPQTNELTLGIATLAGVRYLLESSLELVDWDPVAEFTGTGNLYPLALPQNKPKEFFRYTVIQPPQ